jgi:hypothetical protein
MLKDVIEKNQLKKRIKNPTNLLNPWSRSWDRDNFIKRN